MKKVLTMTVALWALLAAMFITVNAASADRTAAGNVLRTDTDTEVYQDASEASGLIAVLDAGTVVWVTDDTVEGWCGISAKEVRGYIKSEHLVLLDSSDEMNLEFEQIENNYHMLFNEVQQLESQRRQTRIWGSIIALLTVGIFAAGIVPVIKRNRKDEKNRR